MLKKAWFWTFIAGAILMYIIYKKIDAIEDASEQAQLTAIQKTNPIS